MGGEGRLRGGLSLGLKFKGGSKNNREGREGCEEKHESGHLLVL
jgi:hypothetical protein